MRPAAARARAIVPAPPWTHLEPNHQIQVLGSAFYRNKAAYVVGKIVNGHAELPFVVPVLHDAPGGSRSTRSCSTPEQINVLFSLSRAYFMVDMEVPSGYVEFLRDDGADASRAPSSTRCSGSASRARRSSTATCSSTSTTPRTRSSQAPGIRGQGDARLHAAVVPVRVQGDQGRLRARQGHRPRDRRGEVRDGRSTTTASGAWPTRSSSPTSRSRATASPPSCSTSCDALAPSMIEDDGDALVDPPLLHRAAHGAAQHLPRPRHAATSSSAAVVEYGNAIRDLAIANIFPGDMLWQNFGVTRYGRVVFYDYDEIEYLTDVNFRAHPGAAEPGSGARGRAVVRRRPQRRLPRGVRDVPARRPAAARAVPPPPRRPARARSSGRTASAGSRRGEIVDFFPYPESLRFCNRRGG